MYDRQSCVHLIVASTNRGTVEKVETILINFRQTAESDFQVRVTENSAK